VYGCNFFQYDERSGMDDLNAPATKGDILQLRTEMNHQYNDLVERIADSETKLLQAFYSFAESNQQRTALIL
jgi:hypothetical protein